MNLKTKHNKEKNPFTVPEGYFDSFQDRLMDRIASDSENKLSQQKKIHLRPFLALAASITGIALVTYLVLQNVSGNYASQDDFYNIELIDETGIIQDESVMAETYEEVIESAYTDWEEAAMNYLASNEMDVLLLME